MELNVKSLDITAGGRNIVLLNNAAAAILGAHSSDRVEIICGRKHAVAIMNIDSNFRSDEIGLYRELSLTLGAKDGEQVEIRLAQLPESLRCIQAKIRNERLRGNEIDLIVRDVVERHLSDIELASFLTALDIHGLSMDEIEALSNAMVNTGLILSLGEKPILDKHSIGGVPGDKTTILIVPIVAAAGYVIPKTSSRAVTSPAGTADRVEVLCPVSLSIDEIRRVVEKTNGCMAWGGALELAPADDIFIQIEYPLAIDPMLLPSIMSKKKAIGASHLVIDIPTGKGAKIQTVDEANSLAYDFLDLGKRLGINVQCGLTFGDQPIGCAVGPALEAREALSTIMGDGPRDLWEKATGISGILLEMVGVKNGKEKATQLLKSGKAERKLRQIIQAQGGDPEIRPEDIKVGDKKATIVADRDGGVTSVSNQDISEIAREAGAPKDLGAGLLLKAKLGDHVKKGDVLFEILAERGAKLASAAKLAGALQPIGISARPEDTVLIGRIPLNAVYRRPSRHGMR